MIELRRLIATSGLLIASCSIEARCVQRPAPVSAEERSRVEYYDAHGRRSSYSVTDPRTGITDVYDAKTSRHLGTFRSPQAVYDTKGQRVDGGLPALALPPGKAKGGKK